MTSSLQDVYTAFFDRVEKDRDFFRYFEVEEEIAMKLAEEPAKTFLKEACSYIRRHIPLGFELKIVQGEDAQDRFAEEITDDEVELLADVMMLPYYERGLVDLLPKINTFSASELKLLHSPANERQTYVALIEQQRARIDYLLADYFSKDRLTGEEKYISTTLPEESDE